MRTHRRSRHIAAFIGAGIAMAMLVTACGSNSPASNNSASQTGTPDSSASDASSLVPEAIRSEGKLIVATDATFPPSAFYGDNKQLTGADVDLANALAGKLGLTPEVTAAAFDSIIPGIQAGKYTLGMSLVNITAERMKVIDYVSYFQNGSSILVASDSSLPEDVTLANMCGHSIAVQRAAVQADFAKDQSEECAAAGEQPIDVQVFPDYNAATLAIAGGRVESGLFDQTNAAYTAQQPASKLKVVGPPFGQTPCGIVMQKDNDMAPAVLAALNELVAEGMYEEILAKYGLQDGAVTAPEINPTV